MAGGVFSSTEWMMAKYNKIYELSGAKIHGLGFVKHPQMWQCDLFSVDSSSWMQGQRWGQASRYTHAKGVQSFANLTQVVRGKQTLTPEEKRLLSRRGIQPDKLTARQFSSQTTYAASETTSAYVHMMTAGYRMHDAGKASVFLSINKTEDLAMIAASITCIKDVGDSWTYEQWINFYDIAMQKIAAKDISFL